jgi:hypothetical protein
VLFYKQNLAFAMSFVFKKFINYFGRIKMKKILFIAIVALFTYFNFVDTNAQDPYEPCLPDCPNSNWSPPMNLPASQVTIFLCGKEFTVRYRTRHACGIWWDYYIEVVGTDNLGDISNCIDDEYGDLNSFLQAATEQLMIVNPGNYPPHLIGECATNWRVMKGSCFMLESLTGGVLLSKDKDNKTLTDPYSYHYSEFALPCNSTDCCLEFFTVCIDMNEERTITQTGYLPPEDPDCISAGGWGCEPVCGSIYNR